MLDGFAIAETADRLAVHLDVGDDVDLGQAFDEAAAILLNRRPVKFAEAAAERDQLLVAERLPTNEQHRMLVPSVYQPPEHSVVEISQIDAPYLGRQRCASRDYVECVRAGAACPAPLRAHSHASSVISATFVGHCALMLDALITLAHLANSALQ